jgi:purine catabolism regulator
MLLDPGREPAAAVRHLRHFGFKPADPVMLVVATSARSTARLLDAVNNRLEATARPHVVTRVHGGVAALVRARDAGLLVDQLDRTVRDAGLSRVVIGVSGSLPQTAVAAGLAPARQAAAAAQREQRAVGWFDELALSSVLADDAIRSRIRARTEPAVAALVHNAAPRDANLLESLEAFLQHNGSPEAAARELGVHRHTLSARMARVEDLPGCP